MSIDIIDIYRSYRKTQMIIGIYRLRSILPKYTVFVAKVVLVKKHIELIYAKT